MTREEKQKAIDAIKISAPVMAMIQEEFNDYIQTINQIMDWLEQEPCEDCISRQAAIDACLSGWNKDYKEIVEEIRTLPPVTLQLCEDAIGRKAVLNTLENMDRALDEDRTVENYKELLRECYKVLPSVSKSEKPNKCEDAISRYQKIKQMLYEFKEMPLAPCLMKGHICAVHEILNEVMEPSTSSSQKPKSEWEHDHEILKAYSDGANAMADKIRAEIEQLTIAEGGDDYVRKMAELFSLKMKVLQIIDKCMEEDKA